MTDWKLAYINIVCWNLALVETTKAENLLVIILLWHTCVKTCCASVLASDAV